MRTRLLHLWEVVTTGYWFVPTMMSVGAVVMALVLLWIDGKDIDVQQRLGWLYAGGPDGAQTLLSTVAGSVITVGGVAFSITIAALSQASSQFGPRLLRSFMRDTGNQIVLGTFVATFLYCLMILRTIHGEIGGDVQFVPQASVTVAVMMAGASIAVLIYFIHHVSVSLQAPAIVAAVAADLERVIARLPEGQTGTAVAMGGHSHQHALPHDFDATAASVRSTREGYVQAVDYTALLHRAEREDLILHLNYRPGEYVIEASTLLRAWPSQRLTRELEKSFNRAFICGDQATPEQDVEYAIRQMVEVAVRALSPGVNDPFTAINCIDALGAAVCRVARRGLPGPHRYGGDGKLRILTSVTTFTGIADMAFNQIRQYGRQSVAVSIRLLEVIEKCAQQMTTQEQRQALLRQAEMVYAGTVETTHSESDRADVRSRWQAAVRALDSDTPLPSLRHAAPMTAGEPRGI